MLSPTVIPLGPLPSAHPAMAGAASSAAATQPVVTVIAECVDRLCFERPPALVAAALAA
jgi:hypothetical protein